MFLQQFNSLNEFDSRELIKDLFTSTIQSSSETLENKVNSYLDTRNPEEILKYMSPIVSLEQAKIIAQYETSCDPDGKLGDLHDEKFKLFAGNAKSKLKKIIKLQKQIISELKSVDDFFNNNFTIYLTPCILETWAKISPQLVTKMEIRECGIKNLLDKLTLNDN